MKKLLMATAAFLGCALARAEAASDFPSPEAFVQSLDLKVSRSAQGDLNGDGLQDWIGAVAPALGEDSLMHRIVVLLQRAPGRYELAGSSGSFSWWDTSIDAGELDIEIRKGSFYVSFRSYSRRCDTASRAQFRLEGDQWRMIGATYRQSNTNHGKPVPWYSQDANLLTGDEILTVQGAVRQRSKFSPLLLDLGGFPLEYQKAFRTKAHPVCN